MPERKILLLNFHPDLDSTYTSKGAVYPTTAILLLGTTLKKNGYDVSVIDGAYHEDYLQILENSIKYENILFVGMSVMTTQISYALEASKIVKQRSQDIPIIWGGPHPTLFPKQTLCDRHIDIVAINEATKTIVDIAGCLQSNGDLSTISGIGYKDNNSNIIINTPGELDDINEISHFDFSLIDIEPYLNPKSTSVFQKEFPRFNGKIRVIPILTGLGCPYKCEFCINPILKRRYRFRKAQDILQEIKQLQEQYKANTFFFLDEDFFVNKRRVLEFLSIAEEENLHFNFRMWCRVDHFRDDYINTDLLKRLTGIGHVSLVMGAESGNQEMLDNLNKGITIEQTMNSLKLITGTGIFPRYSFIIGLENETFEQIKETYRFCLKMKKINPEVDIAGPFIFRLYPGSPIYNRLVDKFSLKLPESPNAWAKRNESEIEFTPVPWTPKQFQKVSRLISFYSFALNSQPATRLRFPKRALYPLFIRLARFRLNYFFFRFPFDYWILSVISRLQGKTNNIRR